MTRVQCQIPAFLAGRGDTCDTAMTSHATGPSGPLPTARRKQAGQGRGQAPCPICGKPADAGYRPFCSRRCADVDLNRWLNGSYVIPGEEAAGADAEDGGEGVAEEGEE